MTISTMVLGKSDGIAGYSTTGCTCHSSTASPSVGVSISGPTSVTTGTTNTYTVTVTGGPLAANGLDVSATGGTLVVTDSTNTKLLSGEIVQTVAGTSQTSWSFDWTAPSTSGTVTLYVAGFSGDGDGKKDVEDLWNLASLNINVQGAPPVPEFPLGFEAVMAIGLGAVVIYIWWRGTPKNHFR
ncbi:MAG: choice-of-anchor V domain-containing protein [Candidatus Bathyarchaeia archaeon]